MLYPLASDSRYVYFYELTDTGQTTSWGRIYKVTLYSAPKSNLSQLEPIYSTYKRLDILSDYYVVLVSAQYVVLKLGPSAKCVYGHPRTPPGVLFVRRSTPQTAEVEAYEIKGTGFSKLDSVQVYPRSLWGVVPRHAYSAKGPGWLFDEYDKSSAVLWDAGAKKFVKRERTSNFLGIAYKDGFVELNSTRPEICKFGTSDCYRLAPMRVPYCFSVAGEYETCSSCDYLYRAVPRLDTAVFMTCRELEVCTPEKCWNISQHDWPYRFFPIPAPLIPLYTDKVFIYFWGAVYFEGDGKVTQRTASELAEDLGAGERFGAVLNLGSDLMFVKVKETTDELGFTWGQIDLSGAELVDASALFGGAPSMSADPSSLVQLLSSSLGLSIPATPEETKSIGISVLSHKSGAVLLPAKTNLRKTTD